MDLAGKLAVADAIVGAHFNAPVWSRLLRGLTEVSPYDDAGGPYDGAASWLLRV